MARPKEILSEKEYENYRNVRATAILFIAFGLIALIGGPGLIIKHYHSQKISFDMALGIAFVIIAILAAIGAIATLWGSRRWAKLTYVLAWPYLLCAPFGTILAYTILKGLPGYLDSKERLQQANVSRA
jgi:fatty acid desaturase